jgi:hypothetical protein
MEINSRRKVTPILFITAVFGLIVFIVFAQWAFQPQPDQKARAEVVAAYTKIKDEVINGHGTYEEQVAKINVLSDALKSGKVTSGELVPGVKGPWIIDLRYVAKYNNAKRCFEKLKTIYEETGKKGKVGNPEQVQEATALANKIQAFNNLLYQVGSDGNNTGLFNGDFLDEISPNQTDEYTRVIPLGKPEFFDFSPID